VTSETPSLMHPNFLTNLSVFTSPAQVLSRSSDLGDHTPSMPQMLSQAPTQATSEITPLCIRCAPLSFYAFIPCLSRPLPKRPRRPYLLCPQCPHQRPRGALRANRLGARSRPLHRCGCLLSLHKALLLLFGWMQEAGSLKMQGPSVDA